METIRRVRQAIGPESETLILVGFGIAAFLLWVHFVPDEGWPALILPILVSVFVVGAVMRSLVRRGWRPWLRRPLELTAKCAAFAMIFSGMTMNRWAKFKGMPDSSSANDITFAGLIVVLAIDLVSRWWAGRKSSQD